MIRVGIKEKGVVSELIHIPFSYIPISYSTIPSGKSILMIRCLWSISVMKAS